MRILAKPDFAGSLDLERKLRRAWRARVRASTPRVWCWRGRFPALLCDGDSTGRALGFSLTGFAEMPLAQERLR